MTLGFIAGEGPGHRSEEDFSAAPDSVGNVADAGNCQEPSVTVRASQIDRVECDHSIRVDSVFYAHSVPLGEVLTGMCLYWTLACPEPSSGVLLTRQDEQRAPSIVGSVDADPCRVSRIDHFLGPASQWSPLAGKQVLGHRAWISNE
jgi:hypothetical protein